jgi:hypothetical protein
MFSTITDNKWLVQSFSYEEGKINVQSRREDDLYNTHHTISTIDLMDEMCEPLTSDKQFILKPAYSTEGAQVSYWQHIESHGVYSLQIQEAVSAIVNRKFQSNDTL